MKLSVLALDYDGTVARHDALDPGVRAAIAAARTAGIVVLLVTGSGTGWIRVNADEYRESLVLTPDAVHPGAAPGGFDALTPSDFAALLEHQPEIVLLGTGAKQTFPPAIVMAACLQRGIGIEVMTNAAAARTYSVLAGEGRRVVAGFVFPA